MPKPKTLGIEVIALNSGMYGLTKLHFQLLIHPQLLNHQV